MISSLFIILNDVAPIIIIYVVILKCSYNCFMTTHIMFYIIVPVYHVRAVAGQQARLPCDISLVSDEEDDLSDPGADSPPLDGESSLASGANLRDAVLLVLWYRDDLGTPIYRY